MATNRSEMPMQSRASLSSMRRAFQASMNTAAATTMLKSSAGQ